MKNRTDYILMDHIARFTGAVLIALLITAFIVCVGLGCLAFAYWLITHRPELTTTVWIILTLAVAAIAQLLTLYLKNKVDNTLSCPICHLQGCDDCLRK